MNRPQDNYSFHHIGFTTPSLERSIAFWTDVVGFQAGKPADRVAAWVAQATGVPGATIRTVQMQGLGVHFELVEYGSGAESGGDPISPSAAGAGHICIATDDVQSLYDLILQGGGHPLGRPAEITEGPASGRAVAYARDPFGIIIEILQKPSE